MAPEPETPGAAGGQPPGRPPEDDFGIVEDTRGLTSTRRVDRVIALRQEGMRGLIAAFLLLLLAAALIWSLTTVGSWSEMSELLQVWLPALTGLLGSAVGFYFGTRG